MTTPAAWLILLLVLGRWLTLTRGALAAHPAPLAARRLRGRRPFRPQPPAACPRCGQTSASDASGTASVSPPPPWRERKSRRGAPKRVPTDGSACTNPACLYAAITGAAVHALVAAGHHGRDHLQDVRCQACGCRVSARRHPPR
jgi:hypothetical protein